MKRKEWNLQAIIDKGLTVTGGAGKLLTPGETKPSKYLNKKVTFDGILFDSQKEADRWGQLKVLERLKQIQGLQRQVIFNFIINDQLVCKYVADFTYQLNCERVVEDVKSSYTRKLPVYRIKCKLMKAIYGIEIKEI
jgi:hypothetical protein